MSYFFPRHLFPLSWLVPNSYFLVCFWEYQLNYTGKELLPRRKSLKRNRFKNCVTGATSRFFSQRNRKAQVMGCRLYRIRFKNIMRTKFHCQDLIQTHEFVSVPDLFPSFLNMFAMQLRLEAWLFFLWVPFDLLSWRRITFHLGRTKDFGKPETNQTIESMLFGWNKAISKFQ